MVKQRNPFSIFFILFALAVIILALSWLGLFGGFMHSPFVVLQKNLLQVVGLNVDKHTTNLERNLSLLEKLTDQKKLQNENKALLDQFSSSHFAVSSLLPVGIVSEPSLIPGVSLPEYLILDQGKKNGVKIGQPVVYKNNLIGLILKTNDSFSQVTLLTNSTVSFPVKTIRTGVLGIAKGQGNGILILDNVVLSDRLEKDDVLMTYGNQTIEGIGYPSGLIVGSIASVEKNPSAIFQKARIKSLVDITRLTTVFVVVGR